MIQGSKLWALFYALYINEVTILQKLMNTDIYDRITGVSNDDDIDGIGHNIMQYVDDTNNVISTNNLETLQPYINKYLSYTNQCTGCFYWTPLNNKSTEPGTLLTQNFGFVLD